jgi:excinuclease ABC subunit A
MSDIIELQGVRVHNLKNVSLQIPHDRLTVICGVSGSGKSSLAFDTLFAEGQRRYIETFSPGARQFLDRIERPAADRIDGIPPAVAIRQRRRRDGRRSTVGTRTEIIDYLRLLFVNCGQLVCPSCGRHVGLSNPERVAELLLQTDGDRRAMVTFRPFDVGGGDNEIDIDIDIENENENENDRNASWVRKLIREGYVRAIIDERTVRLDDITIIPDPANVLVVLDRIKLNAESCDRLQQSLEAAFAAGDGRCIVLTESGGEQPARERNIDGSNWMEQSFSRLPVCGGCGREMQVPTVASLNFASPLGACPDCEGTGSVGSLALSKVVPDDTKSIREGAIEPWNTPAYRHELVELLALADDYQLPVDQPFSTLSAESRRLIEEGVAERDFGGLNGFHQWLVRHRYKTGVSVFLNRWRSWSTCKTCNGRRLNQDSTSVQLDGKTISAVCEFEIDQLMGWVTSAARTLSVRNSGATERILRQLRTRIGFLIDSGLSYVTLNRRTNTLSGGESQRVMLTAALGSGLINTLYVLDEPTSGLHASDTSRIIDIVQRLKNTGNTVVVVEHDPQFIQAADFVVEIGPDAGANGGEIVFTGTPSELLADQKSVTGKQLAGYLSTAPDSVSQNADAVPKSVPTDASQSQPDSNSRLSLRNICCHNVQGLDVDLPLRSLCAIIGVSGSGKSSLIVDALYPALCRVMHQPVKGSPTGSIEQIHGAELIDSVMLLDQSPLVRSGRSVPITWIGAFDDIRKVFAQTHEAKKRNLKPGMFSFNAAKGGRCSVCHGLGIITVEMQFLADVQTVCDACHGRRFRSDVLEVRYRDRSISDILDMTADEAFQFFNGHRRIQQKVNAIRHAGLSYLQLGQPLSTLSGGESQRLRIASLLAGVPMEESFPEAHNKPLTNSSAQPSSLFLLDEPSTGLHLQDIDRLVGCLRHLLQIGHSVIVIEHDDYLIRQCDYFLEMGPGAGRHGGTVVRQGPLPG